MISTSTFAIVLQGAQIINKKRSSVKIRAIDYINNILAVGCITVLF